MKSKSSISRNTVRFHAHANGKVNNKTPAQQKLHAHMLSVLYLVWSWNQRAARHPIPGRLWLAACSGQSPGGGGASDNKWMQPRVQEQWGAAQDSQETPDQPIKDTAEALPILLTDRQHFLVPGWKSTFSCCLFVNLCVLSFVLVSDLITVGYGSGGWLGLSLVLSICTVKCCMSSFTAFGWIHPDTSFSSHNIIEDWFHWQH